MLSLIQNLPARKIAWDVDRLCLMCPEVFKGDLNIILGNK